MSVLLLLLVMSPVVVAELMPTEYGQRLAWYEMEALLVVVLLSLFMLRERRWSRRIALCAGIGLHALSFGCGILNDSAACDSTTGLPGVGLAVLIALAFCAELLERLEAARCRHRKMT
jgi:uncharacterized membrane protein YhfC